MNLDIDDLLGETEEKPKESAVQKMNFTIDASNTPPIRKTTAASYERKNEQPRHRMYVELAASGWTAQEIAKELGCRYETVNDILKQQANLPLLAKRIHENFGTDQQVVEVIKRSVVASVELYEAVVADPKQKMSDRIAAADRLLERRYGKANQPINRDTDVDLNALNDDELLKMARNDN